MGVVLFSHNLTAYENVRSMLAVQGKAAVIHPTGTGKSYIAFKLIEDNPDKKFLWLSPSEYIFQSQMDSLHRSNPELLLDNITYLTYAKLIQMTTPIMETLEADYIILDEFHRCGARQWGRGVEELLKVQSGAKLLGLTATNVRYLDNQRDMAEELFQNCIASQMALGEAIVRGILPAPLYVTTLFQWQGEFKRYEKRVARQKNKERKETNEAYLDELRHALENAEGLDRIFQKYVRKGEKYIVFCSNVEHMSRMVSHVEEWFSGVDNDTHCYVAFSENPESSQEFLNFNRDNSEHLKLLFCIDMLNEGIHVNDISGVIMFRPTVSPIIYKQQIGRALTSGTVKTPVILDVVDCQSALSSVGSIQAEMQNAVELFWQKNRKDLVVQESFQVIEQVYDCRILFEKLERNLSHSWEDYFEAACQFVLEYGHLRVPTNYVTEHGLHLGQWIATQKSIRNGMSIGKLSEEQIQRLDSIGMVWGSLVESKWEHYFSLAEAYYKENGNLLVPCNFVTKDGVKLGLWIDRLRQQKTGKRNSEALSQERIERLEGIGMEWMPADANWNNNYSEAKRYFETQGNLRVPHGFKTETGFALGAWLNNLRNARKRGSLSEEHILLLDEIGMEWGKRTDYRWIAGYQAAKEYYEVHGNLAIKKDYVDKNGFSLGRWLERQKQSRISKQTLSEERIAMLDAIGMDWGNRFDMQFTVGLECATEYYQKFGDLMVPVSYCTEDGFKLGQWISDLRRRYKNGELNQQTGRERMEQLNKIGMVWDVNGFKWQEKYKDALKYYEEHGSIADVPTQFKSLYKWVSSQKRNLSSGKLSEQQIELLKAVGIVEASKVSDVQIEAKRTIHSQEQLISVAG